MTKDEALNLAQKELIFYRDFANCQDWRDESQVVITAIKEALANHIEDNLVMVQEPIGEARLMQNGFTHCIWSEYCVPVGTKLYTAREKNA